MIHTSFMGASARVNGALRPETTAGHLHQCAHESAEPYCKITASPKRPRTVDAAGGRHPGWRS